MLLLLLLCCGAAAALLCLSPSHCCKLIPLLPPLPPCPPRQALEDRLLLVNGERNELQAESARMPSHTTGRTLQVRVGVHSSVSVP